MKSVDKYTLRISNTNDSSSITENAEKDIFTLTLPNIFKNRGRCYIRVVSGLIQVEDVDTGSRIVEANVRIVAVRSNIPMLGYDTNNQSGSNTILGTGILTSDTTELVNLDTPDSGFGFTCPQLPNEIVLEKLYIDPDTQQFERAKNYTTTTLPCFVELEIIFFDDIEC